MTEPTDDELLALIEKHLGLKPRRDDTVIDPRTGRFHDVQRYRDMKADILAKWGTPPAVAKWAPEEISDGERGIRWVTNDGIHGRPTDHDVREYLKRTPTAHGCHCDECKQFYTTPQPTQPQAGAVPLTCEWTHNDDDSSWDTECGQSWRFDDGGPKENHMNFCHCCGKTLRIKGGQHGTE